MNAKFHKETSHSLHSRWILPLVGLLCLFPFTSSAIALFLGILTTLLFGNPYTAQLKLWTNRLLKTSIIGLGAGMNLFIVAAAGKEGVGYTLLTLAATFLVGSLLGIALRIQKNISLLITAGTAICGGSAIAALAPVLKAKNHEVSVALGTVFILNACALFLFPMIGQHLAITEEQFGLWSALAIHDTSSVVGASLQYGPRALEVGTTVKLARALWILPLTFFAGLIFSRQSPDHPTEKKPKVPGFILGFILMAALVTWIPSLQPIGEFVESLSKRLLVLTLFLIGSSLTWETLKKVGLRPFLQGIALWFTIASGTLMLILKRWIS